VTRTPLSRSKGQRSRSPGRFAHRGVGAAAAVGMRTCWPWETAATLPTARRRKVHDTHEGKERRGHIVAAARLQLVKHVSLMLYAKFDGNF